MKNLKSIINFIFILFTSLFFTSCLKNENEGRIITGKTEYMLTIASQKVKGVVSSCGNNYLTDVYAAKKEGDDTWQMQTGIQGFDYESGYEYTIKIQKINYLDYRMGDPSWTEYKLIQVISKEKKTSENIPDNFIPEWYDESLSGK